MAAQKKRKHASVEDQSKQTPLVRPQQGIKSFGSIGKATIAESGLKKRKTIHEREATPPPVTTAAKSEEKRKRGLDIVEEETNEVSIRQYKRPKGQRPPSPAQTPSKGTAALFGKLKLDPNVEKIPFALASSHQGAYDTPPLTPEAEKSALLPKELAELSQLYAAFLSALSLHYAHNGTTSPVNVKALLPMVTSNWKRRTVTLDDLRIILAVGQDHGPDFTLKNFGRAGICLAQVQPRGRAVRRAASYVDEIELSNRFDHALQKTWTEWLDSTPKENGESAVFVKQLRLAEITESESVEKAAPMFARGQQRLADLKASQAAANPEQINSSEVLPDHKTNKGIQNRGSSLLDRILAKQANAASLPAGPTRTQLERKAALQRVEDIVRILDLMAAGRARCSFSMQAVVQQLQQSLRNPISREEVEKCLGLMSKEITPALVSLVQSGFVTGVVVTKGGKLGLEDLRRRLQEAGA